MALLWGSGECGALGSGLTADSAEAAQPGGSIASSAVRSLALGRSTSAAVDVEGGLHLWGKQWGAKGGSGPNAVVLLPRRAPPGIFGMGRISIEHIHSCGRKLLLTCRKLDAPKSGDGVGICSVGVGTTFEYLPGGVARKLSEDGTDPAVAVSGGGEETLVLTQGGACLRLAHGLQVHDRPQPLELPDGR